MEKLSVGSCPDWLNPKSADLIGYTNDKITTAHRPSYKNDTTGDISATCRWCTSYKMTGITQALIKAHLTIRDSFRNTQQWEEADKIRVFLESLGVEVKDKRK